MKTGQLIFTSTVTQIRPHALTPLDDAEDFLSLSLVWGTEGSAWIKCGRYDGAYPPPLPRILVGKETSHYTRTHGPRAHEALQDHVGNRKSVWVARGVGYGLMAFGAGVTALGVPGHFGQIAILKGVALGSVAGAIAGTGGGLFHTAKSTQPYQDQLDFLLRLDDLVDLYNGLGMRPWMERKKDVSKVRLVAPEVFDQAMIELREEGIQIGKTFKITAAWKDIRNFTFEERNEALPPRYGSAVAHSPNFSQNELYFAANIFEESTSLYRRRA